MISLRNSLEKIGEPELNGTFKPIPSGFHSCPQSLKSAMHAMNPPLIESWNLAHTSIFANKDWTHECQGLTTDGSFWYVVSNNDKEEKAVYKFSLDFVQINREVFQDERHIGHPGYLDGKIYVPVEDPNGHDDARVWVLDTNLSPLGGTFYLGGDGDRPQGEKMPWCAINPWNSYLYSSPSDGVDTIFAYDPSNSLLLKGELHIEGEKVNLVQGGCFSENGHLYLSSYDTDDIRAYSALNGSFLGSCKVPYDKGWLRDEEMEGLTLGLVVYGGVSTYVHVIILDNDEHTGGGLDDVYLKHFAIPDPSVL